MIILNCGEPKTGKSVSAATFPKPMLFLDFDDGFKSVQYAKDKNNKLIVPDWADIKVERLVKRGRFGLDFKTNQSDKTAKAPEGSKASLDLIIAYDKIIMSIQPDQYKTLVIDPLSMMFRIWKEALCNVNQVPQVRLADYATLESNFSQRFLPTLKELPVDYVILLNHIVTDKDELTGRVMEFPVGTSNNQGQGLSAQVDEVWRQVIETGEYKWRTRQSGFFKSGSRLHLPDPIIANHSELKRYL